MQEFVQSHLVSTLNPIHEELQRPRMLGTRCPKESQTLSVGPPEAEEDFIQQVSLIDVSNPDTEILCIIWHFYPNQTTKAASPAENGQSQAPGIGASVQKHVRSPVAPQWLNASGDETPQVLSLFGRCYGGNTGKHLKKQV